MVHAFVINMDTPNGRARWPKVQTVCEAAGVRCERVTGVNGAALTDEEVARATTAICRHVCSPGMVGCAMSHQKCWGLVVERGLPWAIVLEDDVELADNFSNSVRQVVRQTPAGWHVIALGCHMCGPGVQRVLHGGKRPFDNGVVRSVKFFAGSHAYVVSQEGAQYLMQHAAKVKYHIDYQMSMATPGLRVYAVTKDLAFQGGGYETSTLIASSPFPASLNKLLGGVTNAKGIGWDFYANVPIIRIGPYRNHIVVTPLLVAALALGVFRVSWKLVLGCALLDMLLFPPTSARGPASVLGAYGLGYLTRWGFGRRWRG